MSWFAAALAAVLALSFAAHLASSAVVWSRLRSVRQMPVAPLPPITVLQPVAGLSDLERRTIESTFRRADNGSELLFCAHAEGDPAVPFIRDLMRRYPHVDAQVLVGDEPSTVNPKLDNVRKGWRIAKHDWIVMADSNVLMAPGFLAHLLATWTDGTGLVSAAPAGVEPEGFWAHVECAFLNTHQARWLLTADELGLGFALGKTIVMRKSLIEQLGGLDALSAEVAEDTAATKLVRGAGLRVRLAQRPVPLPIGRRPGDDVWDRQLRWAQLRRSAFPIALLGEAVSTSTVPFVAGLLFASMMDWPLLTVAAAVLGVWFGVEALLAYGVGWPVSWRTPFAGMCRDAMIAVMLPMALLRTSYRWRGRKVRLRPPTTWRRKQP